MTKQEYINLTKKLVSINSITGTKNEKGEYNENILADFILDFFKTKSIPTTTVVTPDGRKCVVVRKNGTTKKTIVLLAHHDTVGIEDYKGTEPLNCDALAKEEKDQRFLYGRGTGDMKAGVALGMGLMEDIYNLHLKTNVIFISAPDEENASQGVLSAGKFLSNLKKKEKLDYIGMINLDCGLEDESTNTKSAIAGGAIGKLLPCFYVVGKSAHVSDPFAGIGSNSIASKLLQEFDLNATYSDKNKITGEIAPPPACLKMVDLKHEYNVQLPLKTFLYFNYLTYHEKTNDVLSKMQEVATKSLKKALEENRKLYTTYQKKQKKKFVEREWDKKIAVYSYTKIERDALKKDQNLQSKISKLLQEKKDLDPRERNMQIVELVAATAQLEAPFIVCFFSPPFYPSSYAENAPFTKQFKKSVTEFGKEMDVNYKISEFSEGISDMNYMQVPKNALKDLKLYMANNPLSQKEEEFDSEVLETISMPITQVGPYAFNPHQENEKVEKEYTFGLLPQLYKKLIHDLQQ